jgi:hypothetical protein
MPFTSKIILVVAAWLGFVAPALAVTPDTIDTNMGGSNTVSLDGNNSHNTRLIDVGPVWTNASTGYIFYLDYTNKHIVYIKTTDGGKSWGAAQTVTGAATVYTVTVWYDRWTPGDAGTKIHIAYIDSTAKDVHYIYLNTSSDTVGGSSQIYLGATVDTGDGWDKRMLGLTKARNGYLYCAYWINNAAGGNGFYCSVDGGANWTAKAGLAAGNPVDQIRLFPGNEAATADIWAIYWSVSATTLYLRAYSNSGNTWTAAPGTTISAGMTPDTGTYLQFSGAPRHSDNHVILAAWNAYNSATACLQVWDIGGTGSITAKTNVVTNKNYSGDVSVVVDEASNEIYAAYLVSAGGNLPNGSDISVKYKKSADGGSTWGDEQTRSTADVASYNTFVCGGMCSLANNGWFRPFWIDRNGAIWFNADSNASLAAVTHEEMYMERSGPVWTDGNTAYIVYVNGSKALVYQKTTDGGNTWAAAVSINTGTIQHGSIWYDKWTPGLSTGLIHCAYLDSGSGNVLYRSINTASGDALSSETTVYAGSATGTSHNPLNNWVDITRARGGYLYVVFWNNTAGQTGFYQSTNTGASWNSKLGCAAGNALDPTLLLPGNESNTNDIWAIYFNNTAAYSLILKVYNSTGNSWTSTNIATGLADWAHLDLPRSFDAMMRHSDNHAIVFMTNSYLTGTGQVWDIANSSTITAKANPYTAQANTFCSRLLINQRNNDIYAVDSYGTGGSSIRPQYRVSSDGGASWSSASDLALASLAETTSFGYSCGTSSGTLCGGRLLVVYPSMLNASSILTTGTPSQVSFYYVWDKGGADTNFSTGENWRPNALSGRPNAGDDVVCNGTSSSNCTLSGNASCNNVTIDSTYTGQINLGNFKLTVYGDWTNNSAKYETNPTGGDNGTVALASTSDQYINGVSQGFRNLDLNNSTNVKRTIHVNIGANKIWVVLSFHVDEQTTIELSDGATFEVGFEGTFSVNQNNVTSSKPLLLTSSGSASWEFNGAFSAATGTSGTPNNIAFQNLSANAISITNGLVGYWKMDETGSGPSVDSINGNNGVWHGSPAPSTSISPSIAFVDPRSLLLSFATSDYVEVPDNSTLNFGTANSFTFALWLNYNEDVNGPGRFMLNTTGITGTGVDIYENSGNSHGRLAARLKFSSGTSVTSPYFDGSYNGTWQHVAAVVDRTNNLFSFYVNGFLSGGVSTDISNSAFTTGSLTSGQPLRFGFRSGASDYFPGILDDIRLYNRALSVGEIRSLAHGRGKAGVTVHVPADVTWTNIAFNNLSGTRNAGQYYLGMSGANKLTLQKVLFQNVVNSGTVTGPYDQSTGVGTITTGSTLTPAVDVTSYYITPSYYGVGGDNTITTSSTTTDSDTTTNYIQWIATPTPITLSDFRAAATPQGRLISWTAGGEWRTVGYRVEARAPGAAWKVVSPLIRARGVGADLARYAWHHAAAAPGTQYRLIEVLRGGKELVTTGETGKQNTK